MKKYCSAIIVSIILMLIGFIPVSYANNQIKLYKMQDSMKNIVVKNRATLMLRQEWYGKKFEINPSKYADSKKLDPVDTVEYSKALKEVAFGIEQNPYSKSAYNEINSSVSMNVYFLDCRLKVYSNAIALSFKDNSTVVFGTNYKMSKEKIHRLAVHEMGHQVDFQLMNGEKWNRYRKIRGLEDAKKYSNSSKIYNERPQEIFAEDFRLLFGGKSAQKISHLNTSLKDPRKVEKLKDFFLTLIVN